MRILVAEDDSTSRLVMSATLRKLGHEVMAVEDGQKALEAWKTDRIGRPGGEELLVVVPGCDREKASRVAERIGARIGSAPVETPAGPLPVTVSLGRSGPSVRCRAGGPRPPSAWPRESRATPGPAASSGDRGGP